MEHGRKITIEDLIKMKKEFGDSRVPKIGDVISSKKFEFAYGKIRSRRYTTLNDGIGECIKETKYLDKRILKIGYINEVVKVEEYLIGIKNGAKVKRTFEIETRVRDKKRKKAKFVVIECCFVRGGEKIFVGCDFEEITQTGWHIRARRLDKGFKYNPNGEVICFFVEQSFLGSVDLKDIKYYGQMEMEFRNFKNFKREGKEVYIKTRKNRKG